MKYRLEKINYIKFFIFFIFFIIFNKEIKTSLRRPIKYRLTDQKRGGIWLRTGVCYCVLICVLNSLGRHVSLVYVA